MDPNQAVAGDSKNHSGSDTNPNAYLFFLPFKERGIEYT
jgi:hypothetical protein